MRLKEEEETAVRAEGAENAEVRREEEETAVNP
jgi:hypothetical protein